MAEERTGADPLDAGWDALSEGSWRVARACFEEALAAGETPEALEGLGWAGYCLDDARLTFDARERAYRPYRERHDGPSAARVAAWLASACLEFRGEPAVANGWLQRAHSLLDDLEPGPDRPERCDAEHVPAYLETSTPRGRALDERNGFEVVEECRLAHDAPPGWRMWREPRA